jgi:hypothetical protein
MILLLLLVVEPPILPLDMMTNSTDATSVF